MFHVPPFDPCFLWRCLPQSVHAVPDASILYIGLLALVLIGAIKELPYLARVASAIFWPVAFAMGLWQALQAEIPFLGAVAVSLGMFAFSWLFGRLAGLLIEVITKSEETDINGNA